MNPTFSLGEKVVTKFEPNVKVIILKLCAYVELEYIFESITWDVIGSISIHNKTFKITT
jgi:hypothetical protein